MFQKDLEKSSKASASVIRHFLWSDIDRLVEHSHFLIFWSSCYNVKRFFPSEVLLLCLWIHRIDSIRKLMPDFVGSGEQRINQSARSLGRIFWRVPIVLSCWCSHNQNFQLLQSKVPLANIINLLKWVFNDLKDKNPKFKYSRQNRCFPHGPKFARFGFLSNWSLKELHKLWQFRVQNLHKQRNKIRKPRKAE